MQLLLACHCAEYDTCYVVLSECKHDHCEAAEQSEQSRHGDCFCLNCVISDSQHFQLLHF